MADVAIRKFKKVFMKAQVIFRQNTEGDEMYILEKGRVKISIQIGDSKPIELHTFGPGEFFGEMALFGELKRTATAIAIEDTSVIVITRETMDNQLDNLPLWFVTMFKALIERLRSTNLKLTPENKNDETDSK